ncbi:tripartite tricarboxylate transporter substrate binding protein [Verticiella sediminum]|nr:tripartite tricarboxylate transporter substrate binding protein [Verticiella sediminum]
MLAEQLGEAFRQTFYIDNRPGASGTLGSGVAARAEPDGYTLLFPTCSHAISAVSVKNIPFDSVQDFTPVAKVADSPMVLVANPSLPANSVQELIALAKKDPGALTYATNGPGSITSLGMVLFKSMTGVSMRDIPYKGAGQSLTALIGGEINFMLAPLGAVSAYLQANQLKALAIASGRRSPLVPDLPTIAESGVPGYEATCWYGVLAPKDMPAPIVQKLQDQIEKAMQSAEMKNRLATLGVEPSPESGATFGAYMASEIDKWGKVYKDTGLAQE